MPRWRLSPRKPPGYPPLRLLPLLVVAGLLHGTLGPPAAAISVARRAAAAPETIALANGVHLFLDDYLIEHRQGVTRTVNPPRKLEQPLINGLADSDRGRRSFNNLQFSLSVQRDPAGGLFQMWYTAFDTERDHQYTAYTTSQDGYQWSWPPLPVPGTANNPLVHVYDEGPHAASQRFKGITMSDIPPFWWPQVVVSSDGLAWSPASPTPATTAPLGEVWEVFWDHASQEYVALHRWNQPHRWVDAEGQRHQNSVHLPGHVRLYATSRSQDFLHFDQSQVIFAPDNQDSGETQFYSMSNVLRRGGYYIAMLNVLRDDLKATDTPATLPGLRGPAQVYGIGYTTLAWSRDGRTWHRDRFTDPYLVPSPDPNAWDHAMAWIDGIVEVGDLVYLYYGGYRYGHKVFRDRQIGLAIAERDHYVAQVAGAQPGVLRTPLITLAADNLSLNVDVPNGAVHVRLLGPDGAALPGFGHGDCQPVTGDGFNLPVTCRGSLRRLAGQAVQLEFRMTAARLYGFTLTTQPEPKRVR